MTDRAPVRERSGSQDWGVVQRWTGAAALFVGYAAWLGLGRSLSRFADWANFLSIVGPLVLLATVVPAIVRAAPGRTRRAGVALALAVVGFQAGQLAFAIGALVTGIQGPVYWADVAFMIGYGGLLAGMLQLPWCHASGSIARGRSFLDAATSTAAIATFSWYFVLGPRVMGPTELATLEWTLRLIYPVLDLTCLFLILLLAAGARHRGVPLATTLPLALASLAVAIGNIVFSARLTAGKYEVGDAVDLVWPAGNMLVVLAAWHLCRRPATAATIAEGDADRATRRHSLLTAMLPYVLVAPTVALAIYASRTDFWGYESVGARTGAVAVVGLLLVRQLIVIAENDRLYVQLRDAYASMAHEHEAVAALNRALGEANEQLRSLATTDAMTRLANHRAMQARIRDEIARSRRSGQPFGLILFDVDHFKQLNDVYGHPAGDEVLRAIADVLRTIVRSVDLPARYGGEEFAVVCPHSTAESLAGVAERIREAIEAHAFVLPDGNRLSRPVTVSIGTSSTDVAGLDAEALIRSADLAMYASKSAGRNRVTVACDSAAPAAMA